MTLAKFCIAFIACLVALPVAAQEQATALSNGISVEFLPARNGGMATAVLVCPLPEGVTDEQLADIALINRMIWHGGTSGSRAIQEHEYRMFALRFGGSISSQVQPDALIIQYAMPAELLPEVFAHLQAQWGGLNIDPDRLDLLKSEVLTRERAALTATVQRQLVREVERRIWGDLAYAAESYGSADALNSASTERIQGTFNQLCDPSRWTLVIDGAMQTPELMTSLESTLGTIQKAEITQGSVQPRGTAMLGNALQMPAQVSRNNAVLAYRLPAASEYSTEAMYLLVELIRRSPQFAALRDDLSNENSPAAINVAADIRRDAGMLYLTAAWSAEMAAPEVLNRLRFLVDSVNGEGESAEAFEAARKALLIRYWMRRESAMAYAAWAALRGAVGINVDDVSSHLAEIDAEELGTLSTEMLKRENSLTLVTVVQ